MNGWPLSRLAECVRVTKRRAIDVRFALAWAALSQQVHTKEKSPRSLTVRFVANILLLISSFCPLFVVSLLWAVDSKHETAYAIGNFRSFLISTVSPSGLSAR